MDESANVELGETKKATLGDFISRFSMSHKSEEIPHAVQSEVDMSKGKRKYVGGVLPEDMVITGSVVSECDIKIMGKVLGNVTSKGDVAITGCIEGDVTGVNVSFVASQVTGTVFGQESVTVADGSTVNGNIESSNVMISGAVNGNIKANGHVNLSNTGVVTGDVEAQRISIADGAVINGRLKIDK